MRRWLASLVLWSMIATPAWAQAVAVETLPLSGGGEIWVAPNHDLPLVTISLAFRDSGMATDNPSSPGRARMVAYMLDEGAGELDAVAFHRALEDKAIQFAFGVDDDLFTIEAKTLTENVDETFRLLALVLSSPRFEASSIAQVKERMQAELRVVTQKPEYIALQTLREKIFAGHPYAVPPYGTEAGIAAQTVADLEQFVQGHLTRENLMIAVVGDIAPERAKMLSEQALAKLPVDFQPLAQVPDLVVMTAGQTEIIRKPIPQTVVDFALPAVGRLDPAFYDAYMMNHIVGGGVLTSMLGDEIREKRGLAYYARSKLLTFDHAAVLIGDFGTRNDQAGEAVAVTMETLKKVANGAITPQQLEEAKGFVTGTFATSLATNDDIAGMLITMQRFHLGSDYIAKRNDMINAVTLEGVQTQAAALIKPQQAAIIAVGDPSENLADRR